MATRKAAFRIAARHLRVRLGVGNQRVRLRLAAGARRRRNADRRQHRLRGLAVPAVVAHRAAVGQDEVDPLRAIERAAAAERDDRVDRRRRGVRAPGFDHRGIGVRVEVVEDVPDDAGRLQAGDRASHDAGRHDPLVGDDQRSRKCQLARERAQLVQRAIAENHPCPEREVEWDHREPKILHWPG